MTDLELALRSLGDDAPPASPVRARLDAGHRALRRRRWVRGGAGLVAAGLVLAVTVSLTGRGSDRAVDPPPASPPTASGIEPWIGGNALAGYDDRGRLLLKPGAVVLQRIERPVGARSVALAVRLGDQRQWLLLQWSPGSGEGGGSEDTPWTSASYDPARKAFATLDQWVEDQVALQTGGPRRQYVEFAASGERLRARPGVRILRQVGHPELPDNFAAAGDRSAIAEVRVDGERWWVLARQVEGGPPEYFPVAGTVGGRTLSDFLAYARRQYDSGEGVR